MCPKWINNRQILGGYGYCDEFPVEHFYRDVLIYTIHEDTTGIQGMDLLGRKMMMKKGKAGQLYLTEVRKTIKDAQEDVGLKSYSEALEKALQKLEKITAHLFGIASKGDPEMFLADATLYLELFGIIAIAWQWLKQAVIAKKMLNDGKLTEADNNFYNGKIYTCRYFFGYELPKIEGLAMRLSNGDDLTVNIKNEYF